VLRARHTLVADVGLSACSLSSGDILKTKHERPIDTMQHCVEVGTLILLPHSDPPMDAPSRRYFDFIC